MNIVELETLRWILVFLNFFAIICWFYYQYKLNKIVRIHLYSLGTQVNNLNKRLEKKR